MPESLDPIQQQLIAARRNQILDAATAVFAEKGFHRATIKDIARHAGIADGTIYNYFDNKTALLLALLDRLNETEQREVHFAEATDESFRTFFVAYLRHRIVLLWPNHEVFQAVLPEILINHELRDLYYGRVIAPTLAVAEQYFKAQIEQGHLRRVDVALTVRAAASVVFGLLIMQLLGDRAIAERWEELPEVLATLLLDGLLPPDEESHL